MHFLHLWLKICKDKIFLGMAKTAQKNKKNWARSHRLKRHLLLNEFIQNLIYLK